MAFTTSPRVLSYLAQRRGRRRGQVDLNAAFTLAPGEVLGAAFTLADVVRPLTLAARVSVANAQPFATIGSAVVAQMFGSSIALAVSGNDSITVPLPVGARVDVAIALRPSDDRFAIFINAARVAGGVLSVGYAGGQFAAPTDDLTAGGSLAEPLRIYKGQVPVGFD